jgi:hypothetical protein
MVAIAPRANVGLAIPAGMFVIDIDGEEAHSSWSGMCGRHGAPPRTLTVLTSRGRHLYFSSTVEIHNSTGRIAPSIDVRSNGGYTVAPPSVHPSGHVYAIDKTQGLAIAEAPKWLAESAAPEDEPAPWRDIGRPAISLREGPSLRDARALEGLVRFVISSSPGERNARLYWAACRMREMVARDAMTPGLAASLLTELGHRTASPFPR